MLRPFAILTLALVPAPSPAVRSPLGGDCVVEVGELPVRTFRSPIWNGELVRSLADLRGKPVLVEFWGTRCPLCVGGAVPSSLKLQETYGDDLQVLFVELQGASPEGAVGYALQKKWLGGRAMWTTEPPFFSGSSMLPSCVLLGDDGRVLLKGNPVQQHKEIERLLAEQIRLRRAAPAGTPEALQSAWSEFGKGHFAKAVESARELVGRSAGDAQLLASAQASIATFTHRVEEHTAQINALVAAGMYDEAEARLDDLRRGTHDDARLDARPAEIATRLGSHELSAERTAATALGRMLARFYDSGGDREIVGDLQHFAEHNPGTKAAARALEHVRLVAGCTQGR